MESYTVRDLGCFVCYLVGGNYYTVYTRVLGGPPDMGKQALCEISVGSDEFIEWKRQKIEHYLEEDKRLLGLPEPSINDHSDNSYYGYLERPTRYFPGDKACWVQWIYVVDLDNDTFSVGLPYTIWRIFHLRHIIRSLFDPKPTASGEISEFDHYRVLLDPVPRSCLAGISVPLEPDLGLIELYQSCETQITPFTSMAIPTTFSVRKYLRLRLQRIFCEGHRSALNRIYDNEPMQNNHANPPPAQTNNLNLSVRQILYGIVNLFSSGLEVQFLIDHRYNSTAQWEQYKDRDQRAPLMWVAPPAEYWIGDILVVPEAAMTTAENLHAAIGKAVQVINARKAATSMPCGVSPPTTRALIISLYSLVVVDICGNKLTHTTTMPLLARYHAKTNGILALLDILFTPPPTPFPQSFPALPVEICQTIFRHATADTRRCLEATGRLFRGIAYDYGPRISEWNLQALCPAGSGYFFMAVADRGVDSIGGSMKDVPARRRQVYISTGMCELRPIYRVVLRKPDGGTIELQLPLVGISFRYWF